MIEVRDIAKRFGAVTAVDGIRFDVPKGQVLGFLGPNGAGKTTTMKMLTGYLVPTSGTAVIGGADVVKDSLQVRRQVGYLAESAPSYSEMTVEEFLCFIADVRNLQGDRRRQALGRVREICDLGEAWHRPIETLSKGYRQRVGFAQALIHDPDVLILDEPTDGLDPNQKHEVRRLIKSLGSDKTIILSTHILEEVEAVCERVVIIAKGRIVADARPNELMRQSSYYNAVTINFSSSLDDTFQAEIQRLNYVDRVEWLSNEPASVRVYPKESQFILESLANDLRAKQLPIGQIHVDQGRLDEVFRKITIGESVKQNSH